MMIAMVTLMLLWIWVSVLMTADAAFLHSRDQMQATHELGYNQQHVLSSHVLSRKLMIQEMVEGNGDQDLMFDNDQKEALLDESHKTREEATPNGANGFEATSFTAMDYSHVRRRRPIHNNSSIKHTNSP